MASKFGKTSRLFQSLFVKELVRMTLIKQLTDNFGPNFKKKLLVFTLPGDSLLFEQNLFLRFGKRIAFAGVERVKEVFKSAKKIIRAHRLPMAIENTEDFEYFEKTKEKFDFVWLDWCGGWSPKKLDTFKAILSRKTLKWRKKTCPMIAITVQDGMDLHSIDELSLQVYEEIKTKNSRELCYRARLGGIPKVINKIANEYNFTLRPVMNLRYHDKTKNKKSVPMLVILFKVERGINDYDVWRTNTIDLMADFAGDIPPR